MLLSFLFNYYMKLIRWGHVIDLDYSMKLLRWGHVIEKDLLLTPIIQRQLRDGDSQPVSPALVWQPLGAGCDQCALKQTQDPARPGGD